MTAKTTEEVEVLMAMRIDGPKLRRLRYDRFLNIRELADKSGLNQ
jgi:hypothetical protein